MLFSLGALLLASMVPSLGGNGPESPYRGSASTEPITLEFDALSEPERFGLNGRFVLNNQSQQEVTLTGQKLNAGILKIYSAFNPLLYAVFRFDEKSGWEEMGVILHQGDIPKVEVKSPSTTTSACDVS